MAYQMVIEEFESSRRRTEQTVRPDGSSGVWDAVSQLFDEYGLPSGMDDWNESACVEDEHDCDADPETCAKRAAAEIQRWLTGEVDDLGIGRKIEMTFSGTAENWAAVTIRGEV